MSEVPLQCSFPPDIQVNSRLESRAMDQICTRMLSMDLFPNLPVVTAVKRIRHKYVSHGQVLAKA